MSRAELLAGALGRHRAAGSKVSRLKNDGGVKIGGTKNDPRRDIKKVRKYNKKQLETYIGQLNTFTDRSTRFIGDAKGRPLDMERWKIYKERERSVKAKEDREYAKIKDVRLPKPGTAKASKSSQTIDQRNKAALATRRAGKDRTVNSRFNSPIRKPSQMASNKSLDIMAKAMGKRLAGDYKDHELSEERRIFNDMLDVINNQDLKDQVAKLSDKQFDVMWNHTSMPDDVKDIYLLMKKQLDGEDDKTKDNKRTAISNEEYDQHSKRIGKWLGWANSLKLNG